MRLSRRLLMPIVALGVALSPYQAFAEHDNGKRHSDVTVFSNQGSIANTRHNLTQRSEDGFNTGGETVARANMMSYRNDYGEVCVYCHTPHGANSQVAAPLWNRTVNPGSTYTTYNTQSLTQTVTEPGASSITCLSCHDGTISVDSIINMPGSGGYNQTMETTATSSAGTRDTFLDSWSTQNPYSGTTASNQHMTLSECILCHDAAGSGTLDAVDFNVYMLGTDLTNDHPVGVTFPLTDTFYNGGDVTQTTGIAFFDGDGDGRPDSDDIRLYDTGDGFEVECASCHDPHGVPSGGSGTNTAFNPSFLRKSNAGSGVCLTCHNK